MAYVSLEKLSPEGFEYTNVLLDFEDTKTLRLTNRSMAMKTSQTHFGSFLKSKHVELTRRGLMDLVATTTEFGICCLLEELTLVGVVDNTAGLEYQLETGTKAFILPNDETTDETFEGPEEQGTAAELALAALAPEILKERQRGLEELRKEGKDVQFIVQTFKNIAAPTGLQELGFLSMDAVVFR